MGDDVENRNQATEGNSEQHYELNLDEATVDLQSVIDEAVAAVDRDDEEPEGPEAVEDEEASPGDSDSSSAGSNARSGGSGAPGDPRELADRAARLEAERDALRDRLQRTLADFDNFRKRTDREKKSLAKMGIFDVVKDFLAVIDNLERAMAASGSIEDLKQGLELVLRQQGEVLRRHGVQPVESVGQPFDPTVHEAVARAESDEVEVPMVGAELQKGYLLYDRLLRPAMVHVTVPTTPAAEEASAQGEDSGAGDEETAE